MTDAWEYLSISESERDSLESLGRDGWELTAVGQDGEHSLLYLKRPAPSFRERITLEQRTRYYASLGLAEPNTHELPS